MANVIMETVDGNTEEIPETDPSEPVQDLRLSG
jgi:hypothetical protein